jgi:alpha-L-fucosidase
MSAVVAQTFDVSPARWTVVSTNGEKAADLLAGGKFVGPNNQPLEIVLDLAQNYNLNGFTLKPIGQNLSVDEITRMGPPAGYEIWLSADGQEWGAPVASGEFSNIAASRSEQKIRFDTPHEGRFLRLRLPRAVQDKPVIVFAGFGILTR